MRSVFCSRCEAFEERAIPQLDPPASDPQDWQSVTIDDQISINFILHTESHAGMQSITINYVNQDKEVTKTVFVDVDDLIPYGDYYKVPAEIAPAQIGDTISVTILEANGKTNTYSTSIAEYCNKLMDGDFSAEVKDLAAATLEYGRTANDYFADIGFYDASDITSPLTAEQRAKALTDFVCFSGTAFIFFFNDPMKTFDLEPASPEPLDPDPNC